MSIANKLARKHLETLVPYESARRLFSGADGSNGEVWLNANESPFINEYSLDNSLFNRYPDCQPTEVINAYADYASVDSSQVLCTRGADEGIELLIRTFCEEKQDSVLICPPTYGMYAISAETCGVNAKRAMLNKDFTLDVELIKSYKGEVKIVFICSPNNPTGGVIPQQQIQKVIEYYQNSALVVVDEAYIEFSPENSWATKISEYPNLVVLRTLSKGFALAGLRCGFTLASEEIIQTLLKVIAPYPVPAPVAQVAEQALSRDSLEKMKQQVSFLNQQKQLIAEQLIQISGVEEVIPSDANFVLFRYKHKQQLMDYLVANNIIIRDQSKQQHLQNCLRISVGNQQQNEKLLSQIKQFETAQRD